jgi:drug/metabolite transporter (DMT)-like permease
MYLPVAEKTEPTPAFPYAFLLGIECGLIVALSIFSIFRYKKRRLQIRLGYWNLLLLVMVYVTIFFNVWWYGMEKIVAWKLPALFPLIAIVFTLLAIQAIK